MWSTVVSEVSSFVSNPVYVQLTHILFELYVHCLYCLIFLYTVCTVWTICTLNVLFELYVHEMYCLNYMYIESTVRTICTLNVLLELCVHWKYCLNYMYWMYCLNYMYTVCTVWTHQISLVLKWKMKVCNPSSISENENISFFLFIDLHYFITFF